MKSVACKKVFACKKKLLPAKKVFDCKKSVCLQKKHLPAIFSACNFGES
jgi:hypothetical protein